MEKKAVLLIVNPTAGKGKVTTFVNKVTNHLQEEQFTVDVFYTKKKYDAMECAAQNASNYPLVISCGGDGTLNEVINGLMKQEEKPRLSFIPFGTTNDFAKTLKLPKNKMVPFKQIKKIEEISCDVGLMNDMYFNYIAAFGAFTEVSYATSQTLKNVMGRLAYILEGIKSLAAIKTYHLAIEVEGKTIEDDFIYGGISNSVSVAGFKGIGFSPKEVKLDDGKFEMLFVKAPKNLIEFRKVLSGLLTQHAKSDFIYYYKASQVKIHCETEIPWTVDGEFAGNQTDVKIKNKKRAIEYVIPKIE